MEEQVAVQILICRDEAGREWYRVDAQAPYDEQLRARNSYGNFASLLIEACEACIPLVDQGTEENETVA
jgi:hypothetical protein